MSNRKKISLCMVIVLFAQFVLFGQAWGECTIGVASGQVTVDSRPILVKVRDGSNVPQQVVYVSGSPYSYIGIRSQGGDIFMGLNEAGVATGNSYVSTPGGSTSNSAIQCHILQSYSNLDEIRAYLHSEVNNGTCNASGCFPFIDAQGNASIFEINRSNWIWEYDSIDPDRQAQGLYGFVVRANEFHQHPDGTDDTTITGGRYESGTYNMSGLVGVNNLSVRTIIQGNDGANGYEFARYGPGRPLATIARSSNLSGMAIHGVMPGEDPALSTMWVIMGQANFGIAVPVWVKVSDIPACLSNGQMYERARSLFQKGDEQTIQSSTFPAEAHMFAEVDELLTHWRQQGVPSAAQMRRIEHRMAEDAYSLLHCLDNVQSDNKAPDVSFDVFVDGLEATFIPSATDADGSIEDIEWNFGDGEGSSDSSAVHVYAEEGTYLVSCTVTDDDGVSITDWRYCFIPEPSMMILLLIGGVGLIRRKIVN